MMPIEVKLSKSDASVPWGFRLHGGKDFGVPLTIQKVNLGSLASQCGLKVGDKIISVGSTLTTGLRHKEAQDLIVQGGNQISLTISRGEDILKKEKFSENKSIEIENKFNKSFENSSSVPFKPHNSSFAIKNASLYQSSLQNVSDDFKNIKTEDNNDAFPPPPPPITSNSSFSTTNINSGNYKTHQPTYRVPDINFENSEIKNSSEKISLGTSETLKLVKDRDLGQDSGYNPRTGAGIRNSPIQSKLVDILNKKQETFKYEKIDDSHLNKGSSQLAGRSPSPFNNFNSNQNSSFFKKFNSNSDTQSNLNENSLDSPKNFKKNNFNPLNDNESLQNLNSSINKNSTKSVSSETSKSFINSVDPNKIPVCNVCDAPVRGAYVLAVNKIWCTDHFVCNNPSCRKPLSSTGFFEENGQLYCKEDFEKYYAPKCHQCQQGISGNTVKALGNSFHPNCFRCIKCLSSISGGVFHLHEGQVYCDKDFSLLFSTKCQGCNFPIEVGDNWIEAVGTNWHGECFNCSVCKVNLQNLGFIHKDAKFLCREHANQR